jgi:hypothetical protein
VKRDNIEFMVGWLEALPPDIAILHACGAGVLEIELDDGIYNVFAISDGRVTRIDDYAERQAALVAAGLEST